MEPALAVEFDWPEAVAEDLLQGSAAVRGRKGCG